MKYKYGLKKYLFFKDSNLIEGFSLVRFKLYLCKTNKPTNIEKLILFTFLFSIKPNLICPIRTVDLDERR